MDPEKTEAPSGKPPGPDGGKPVDLSRVKRGRGRPRSPAGKIPNSDPSEHSTARAANAVFDAAFLSDSAICLIEVADEVIARTLAARIAKLVPEKLEEFIQIQRSVGFNAKDKQMVELSVKALAQKYTVLTKFGPELLLLAWSTQYGLRQARLFKFVSEMAEAKAKLDATAPKPAAKVNGDHPGPVAAPAAEPARN